MPLLIRIMTGLVVGALPFAVAPWWSILPAVAVWAFIGLTLARRWEDIE